MTTAGRKPGRWSKSRLGALAAKTTLRPRVRLGAALALAVAVGFVVWLVVRGDGGGPQPPHSTVAALSEQGLRTLASALGRPVYWEGPQPGVTYEFTQTADGRVYVRYLPRGAKVGPDTPYPMVATFPLPNAFTATASAARRPDSVKIAVGGAVAFYSRSSPENVYLATPGSKYQVEVFDPDPARAHMIVARGRVEPVAQSPQSQVARRSGIARASLALLRALPGKLGHTVYWAGPRSGVTYELTLTDSGRVFVRYLPAGARLGTSTRYLFVATFPLKNAFSVAKKAAQRSDAVPISVDGGVGFYSRSSPTNVYLAFPGSNYEVEVFDPDARQAGELVRSGQIEPIR
jgi:hypothetical protein